MLRNCGPSSLLAPDPPPHASQLCVLFCPGPLGEEGTQIWTALTALSRCHWRPDCSFHGWHGYIGRTYRPTAPPVHSLRHLLALLLQVLAVTAVLAAREAPTAGDGEKVSAVRLEIQRSAATKAAAALCEFRGAARRFQVVGRAVERRALVIDDYAHHPTEVGEEGGGGSREASVP